MRYIFLLTLLALIANMKAQDAHYWTEQYGTNSMLLSNSVSGSVEDLGAVFYNPARLSLIEENAFIISGKVYQLSSFKFNTSSEDNRTSPKSKSTFGGAPSLLAGTYRVKGWDKHSFAYSFLGRRRMDVDIEESSNSFGDVLPAIPGDEYFSGDVYLQKKFNEEWFGLSWSYAPNNMFSIGISNFITIRKQNAADETQMYAYTDAEDVEAYKNNNEYSYSHTGLLWKIGLAWNHAPITWGITITTPTVSLSGNGSFAYDYVYTGINELKPIYERNKQSDLDMNLKTPFAIAAGIGYKTKRGSLHASAEYFGAVKEYTLMNSEPFYGQSSNNMYQSFLVDELNSVLNFGVGYNFIFSDNVYGYLSYSTDFSAAVAGSSEESVFKEKTFASTFDSNINHFGGGVVLHLKRADITFGATLATTKYRVNRALGFPEGDSSGIIDPDAYTDVHWNRWRFIVGVSIPFFDEFTKKWEDKLLNKEDTSN
ncbi:hypothetical protein J1N10_18245 [Carboxylicivirga sp. A043]|uniref:hypothetical protein n=1 Tax=Carboxylicivirga litoralis TaxID=2816963 RepID=UPI0021CB3D2F|nr:hypothetical protein [Carboxylicivirga sp. A043]MCU4157920.1 hypothetical protein [Carboxylicivirga sp. A043]